MEECYSFPLVGDDLVECILRAQNEFRKMGVTPVRVAMSPGKFATLSNHINGRATMFSTNTETGFFLAGMRVVSNPSVVPQSHGFMYGNMLDHSPPAHEHEAQFDGLTDTLMCKLCGETLVTGEHMVYLGYNRRGGPYDKRGMAMADQLQPLKDEVLRLKADVHDRDRRIVQLECKLAAKR
jgi:hypothetical protein